TDLAVPGWASFTSGLLVVVSTQILTVAAVVVFFILSNRNNLSFLPIRDWRFFVGRLTRVHPRDGSAPPGGGSVPLPGGRARAVRRSAQLEGLLEARAGALDRGQRARGGLGDRDEHRAARARASGPLDLSRARPGAGRARAPGAARGRPGGALRAQRGDD